MVNIEIIYFNLMNSLEKDLTQENKDDILRLI